MTEERLQKVMAAAGIGSRRSCERLIEAGRVKVNGHTVSVLGTKVDPALVQIVVDGQPLQMPRRFVYYKLYKPRGYLSDDGVDAEGRPNVLDLLAERSRRVFPVGRLDANSEGLILLTDDGDLAHKLTHPRYEHPKCYYVLVATRPPERVLQQLRTGVELTTGRTAPAEVAVIERLPADLNLGPGLRDGVWLEVILHEGKKRQIRHMTATVGFPTLRLVRWAIGSLTLGGLKNGESANLSRGEVTTLRHLVESPTAKASQGRPSHGKSTYGKSTRAGRQTRRTPQRQTQNPGNRQKFSRRNSGRTPSNE